MKTQLVVLAALATGVTACNQDDRSGPGVPDEGLGSVEQAATPSQQVKIVNTAAEPVPVTGTVSIAPGSSVAVAGVVGIDGANNRVRVDNAVAVSGTVTAQQGGNWFFGLLGTPSVTLAGTPSVTLAGTPSVTLAGTPTVSVVGTPTVAVAAMPPITGTVALSGTPVINVSNLPARRTTMLYDIPVSLASGLPEVKGPIDVSMCEEIRIVLIATNHDGTTLDYHAEVISGNLESPGDPKFILDPELNQAQQAMVTKTYVMPGTTISVLMYENTPGPLTVRTVVYCRPN